MSLRFFVLLGLLFTSIYTNAQVDAIKIVSAKKALENKDYTIALQTLSDVSDKGKKNKMYLFYKGEAFYNLMEYDSAEVYYKKYLILDITNTDVVEKLADIDYKRKKAESDKLERERKRVEKENCIKSCNLCKGTGYYTSYYFEVCKNCKGKGEACEYCNLTGKCKYCKGTGIGYKGEYVSSNCAICNGSGVCKENHKCYKCNGNGKIRKEQNLSCYHPGCH